MTKFTRVKVDLIQRDQNTRVNVLSMLVNPKSKGGNKTIIILIILILKACKVKQ